MALSEIEKLERRYAENPQGLTFAPLAEVHRKNGDVARALELLRPGLEHHPEYIPASIVLGRCHLDVGDLPAAEAAFSHVLALDGENVIALKALADINERLMRFDDAERWLHTLLSVDRSNDEARDQLARVETARRQAHLASSANPDTEDLMASPLDLAVEATLSPSDGSPPAPVTVAAAAPEDESSLLEEEEPLIAWVADAGTEATAEAIPLPLADLDRDEADELGAQAPPEGLELEEPVAPAEPVEPIVGLVGRDEETFGELEEFRVETAEDIVLRSSGGSEFQVPDASEELSYKVPPPPRPFEEDLPLVSAADESASPVVDRWTWAPTEPEPETATEPAIPESVPERFDVEPATTAEMVAPPAEPQLVVTETMAEVLLEQGHAAEALRVYRELESRAAGDPRLLRKIVELETAEAAAPAPRRAYAARDTQGQAVGEFLRGVLAARPPTVAPAPAATPPSPPPGLEAAGAPTRPAPDALSLSSVFGEEASASPPAVPAPAPPGAGGVSFDEFFGPAGSTGTPRSGRTPDPKSDDLDQFHAWLQNLKR